MQALLAIGSKVHKGWYMPFLSFCHPQFVASGGFIDFSWDLPQIYPPWYAVRRSCWSRAPDVGGILSMDLPRVKSYFLSWFTLVHELVWSYSKITKRSSNLWVSEVISTGPLLRKYWKIPNLSPVIHLTIVIGSTNGLAVYSNLLFKILLKYLQSNRSHDHFDLIIVRRTQSDCN